MGVAQVPGFSISTEIELTRYDMSNDVSRWQFYLPRFLQPGTIKDLQEQHMHSAEAEPVLDASRFLPPSLRSHPGNLSDAHPPPHPTPSARPRGENDGA